MKKTLNSLVFLGALAVISNVMAIGIAHCENPDEEQWQTQEVLQERLEAQGWKVRRIKEDGGCYEVYATNEENERVEVWFHPVTLEPVESEKEDSAKP